MVWMDLKGKQIAIYYDDKSSYNTVAKKDGFCIDDNDRVIVIRNTSGFIKKYPTIE